MYSYIRKNTYKNQLSDSHSIYRVHIEEQNKMIRVQNLRVFKDTIANSYFSLSDFDKKLTFDGV